MSNHAQSTPHKGEIDPEDTPVSAAVENAAHKAAPVEHEVSNITDSIAEAVRERPYTTLAVAAGVGYIAAAGMPSFLLRVMVGQGIKLATGAIVGAVVANENS